MYNPHSYPPCRAVEHFNRRFVEHFNRRFVEHINLLKDDGYTPLHLAALNDHLDVVTAFAEVVSDWL